jgi:glycosyltransferase involved in cell wall biosynthesis
VSNLANNPILLLKMKDPWLSVIIPSHNGERWLAAALQSVADQGDDGVEVILIDTSASEASLCIAETFADKLALKTYRRPDLRSWPAKTNFGVETAKAEWICVLHQDDLWLPNRCAALRRWVKEQPHAVMHLHPVHIVDERGRRLGIWRCPLPDGQLPVPPETLLERLLVQNFIAVPAPTIRRTAFCSTGGLDDKIWYAPDWDLYLKITNIGDVYYHSIPLACYRIHKNSLTISGSKDSIDFRNQHQIVVDRYADKLHTQSRNHILRIAQASIDVNVGLAGAMRGEFSQVLKAMRSIGALGPRGIYQYFFYSRIVDRALPRLRAVVGGRF